MFLPIINIFRSRKLDNISLCKIIPKYQKHIPILNMPLVTFDYNDFIKILGYNISKKKLIEKLPLIGADLDKVEKNEISIEFFPNRPDLASVEGIARASRTFFDFEQGLKKYNIKKSDIKLRVDSSVKKVRPYIATAIVKNVEMTEELISSLMQLQEKLHLGLGRNRKKVAIGVHNYEPVQPPFTYKAVDPDTVQFVPLGRVESMTMSQILKRHEKGKAYAHILSGEKKHPIIVDKNNNVLSYPPIINGMLTEVTPFTEDLFIDVTGSEKKAVNYALNIVVTALAERGGMIYSTIVEDDSALEISPNLQPFKKILNCEYVNKILGTKMKYAEINRCLNKMGYETKQKSKDKIEVFIPSWRSDILHEIDLIEDVAVGYGYTNFKNMLPKELTFGNELSRQSFFDGLRKTLIGLGFNEVTTFTISNEDTEFKKLGLDKKQVVEIKNPLGEEFSCLRNKLIPSLLKILNENRHHPLPQQIFELGIIADSNFKNRYHLCFVKMDAKANFTMSKALAESIMSEINVDYGIKNLNHPAFIDGRCASIALKGKEIGYFGELHPKTIINFNLEHPIIGFEIDLSKIKK